MELVVDFFEGGGCAVFDVCGPVGPWCVEVGFAGVVGGVVVEPEGVGGAEGVVGAVEALVRVGAESGWDFIEEGLFVGEGVVVVNAGV